MSSTYSLDASNEVVTMTMDYFQKVNGVAKEKECTNLLDPSDNKNINYSFGNTSQCTTASADSSDLTQEYYSYYYQKQTDSINQKNCCLDICGTVCDAISDICNCFCGIHCGIIFGCCD